MTVAIKVENLSKAYQIGQIGTGTISRDIERWFVTKVLGREDPFLKLGQVNDRASKGETDVVWSLKDINLEIEQGDAVGIIGRNGAGKSTLLKLLSRVTSPTTGSIKIKGRVASLLEVGTGFHPELTGRENIYLNGSILGMRKKEIDQKLDEIIEFSGVERYIDTPVKRYSSGMSVRLAFAVAAHLESEILIVDEVLAVGDAEFQTKCLGKIEEVGKREGRTVLFVSHNMSAVQALCRRALLIENGKITFDGNVSNCVATYFHAQSSVQEHTVNKIGEGQLHASKFLINNSTQPSIDAGTGFEGRVRISGRGVVDPYIFFIIESANGQQLVHNRINGRDLGLKIIDGEYTILVSLPGLWLSPGTYSAYFKFLASSDSKSGKIFTERLMLTVTGAMDNSGKSLLRPAIAWECEPQDFETQSVPERMASQSGPR